MTLNDLPSTAAAMRILAETRPLIAIPLAGMKAREDDTRTASIATDGKTVTVNPGFMANRDEQGQVYMLAFISLMVVHDFIGRVGDRDRTAWSMACNMSIHRALAGEGLEGRPAESIILDEAMPEDVTAEQIYDRIMDGRTMVFGRTFDELRKDHAMAMADDDTLPPLGRIVVEGGQDFDTMGGYTHDQLSEAFDVVKDHEHWKNPIDAVVSADKRDVLTHAIPYFTGTAADFDDEGLDPGKLRVFADGYFAGPCN